MRFGACGGGVGQALLCIAAVPRFLASTHFNAWREKQITMQQQTVLDIVPAPATTISAPPANSSGKAYMRDEVRFYLDPIWAPIYAPYEPLSKPLHA